MTSQLLNKILVTVFLLTFSYTAFAQQKLTKSHFETEYQWMVFKKWLARFQPTPAGNILEKKQNEWILHKGCNLPLIASVNNGTISYIRNTFSFEADLLNPVHVQLTEIMGQFFWLLETGETGAIKDFLFNYEVELSMNGMSNSTAVVSQLLEKKCHEISNVKFVNGENYGIQLMLDGKDELVLRLEKLKSGLVGDAMSKSDSLISWFETGKFPKSIPHNELSNVKATGSPTKYILNFEDFKPFKSVELEFVKDDKAWVISKDLKSPFELFFLNAMLPDSLVQPTSLSQDTIELTMKSRETHLVHLTTQEFSDRWKEFAKNGIIYSLREENKEKDKDKIVVAVVEPNKGYYHFLSAEIQNSELHNVGIYPYISIKP